MDNKNISASDLIRASRKTDHDLFIDRVEEQANSIIERSEDFFCDEIATGLEREYYSAELINGDYYLATNPDETFDSVGCEIEIGLHNSEFACEPVADLTKISSFQDSLWDDFDSLRKYLQSEDKIIVRDGIASVPKYEGTMDYLTSTDVHDGLIVPSSMRTDPYYILLDDLISQNKTNITAPGFDHEVVNSMLISLTTSIQPHIQVPTEEKLPSYFSAALRVCGPLMTLSTNSAYCPPDLYNNYIPTEAEHHEHRVSIQRQLLNDGDTRDGIAFPQDIESFEDLMTSITTKSMYRPVLSEYTSKRWSDRGYELDHHMRMMWWWVNPRFGYSPTCDSETLRLELRPFSNQPTFTDVMALYLSVVGSVVGIAESDHPVLEQDWDKAYQNFKEAENNGSNASIQWITREKEETCNDSKIFDDLMEVAVHGLSILGLSSEEAKQAIRPLFMRDISPSEWKSRKVMSCHDQGMDKERAIHAAHNEYISKSYEGTEPFFECPS